MDDAKWKLKKIPKMKKINQTHVNTCEHMWTLVNTWSDVLNQLYLNMNHLVKKTVDDLDILSLFGKNTSVKEFKFIPLARHLAPTGSNKNSKC